MIDEKLDNYIDNLPIYIRNMKMVSINQRNKTRVLKARNTLEYSCFSHYKPVFRTIKTLNKNE